MSNNKERKIPDYLDFPFDRFIMVRVEFLILTQNELEAKVMRIIECAIENRREELSRKGLPIPDEVWVTIPHKYFMDWLHGTIQSETTLKATINSLTEKYLIFKKPSGTGRYDALAFTLNKPLISKLFSLFPKDLTEINMLSIMKQPRKPKKNAEGQLLTPSKINPLIARIREAIIDPLNSQLLTPLSPIIDPLVELDREAIIDPKKEREETQKESKKGSDLPSSTHPLSSLSDDDLLAELNKREAARMEAAQKQFSQQNDLSTAIVDKHMIPVDNKQAAIQADESPIATTTTPSSPPSHHRNTEPLVPPALSGEAQRIDGYWQQLGFISRPSAKKHWITLSKHIQSFEQFESLFKHTEQEILKDPSFDNKTVSPGNLANAQYLDGWKQKKRRAEQPKITEKVKEVVTVGNLASRPISSLPRL